MVCSMSMGRAMASTCEPNAQREATSTDQKFEPATRPRFAMASHELLFAEANEPRCDVCELPLDASEEDEQGAGLYVWSRGGEVRREEVPLCPTCSGSIFASALGMFDFDDEE
jgi:hypothetical protein